MPIIYGALLFTDDTTTVKAHFSQKPQILTTILRLHDFFIISCQHIDFDTYFLSLLLHT